MISVENIDMSYGNKQVLNDIQLSIQKNQPHAILGKNGAGKTTLIKIILGLLKPSKGKVSFPLDKAIFGYLPEERGIYRDVSVEHVLRYFASLGDSQPANYQAYLDQFELLPYEKLFVRNLSKGNQQKLQLAVAFVNNPQFIILDEPFSGLDPLNRELFANIIREYSKDRYILISSHQMDKIESLCAQISFLKNGKIIASGTVDEIKSVYGRKKMLLPQTDAVYQRIKPHYEITVRHHQYEVVVDHYENFKKILTLLEDVDLHFVHYQSSSIEDIYIQLMTKETDQ
nr:ABC transporter ATP-binding protein [Bacilli bacterium]